MLNLPNFLTLIRILSIPFFLVYLSYHRYLEALIIFIIGGITDFLDGLAARLMKQQTPLGAYLDPIADKLLVAAALISLVQLDMVSAWMAAVIVGRELAVTGLRGVALSMGVVMAPSKLGKWKTVTQYVAITLLILEKGVPEEYVPFYMVAAAALWLALAVTVASGVDYFYGFLVRAGSGALVKDRERWP